MNRSGTSLINRIKWDASKTSKVLVILLILVVLSFIMLPVETDIKVFFGNANLASQKTNSNILMRALETWELKGVGNRLIFIILSWVSSLFFKVATTAFVILSKCIYAVVSAIAIFIAYRDSKNKTRNGFCIVMIILFMCGIECHMQAEMSSVIVMILAYKLFAHKDKLYLSLISGIVLGTVFFVKSATIIMIVSFLALALFYKNKSTSNKRFFGHVVLFGLGTALIVVAGLCLIYLIYPTEIKDMLAASKFQSSILSTTDINVVGVLVEFVKTYIRTAVRNIPMLLMVIVIGIYGIVKWIKNKKLSYIYLAIAFVIPALYVLILNSFFSYHYYLFMFPLCILASNKIRTSSSDKRNLLCVYSTAGIVLVLYLIFGSIVSPSNIRFMKTEHTVQEKNEESIKKIKASGDKILYLDSGLGAYILGNDSFSKYYYPLPIQRRKIVEEKQPAYYEMEKDIKEYDGKYITYEKTYMEKDNNLASTNKTIKELLKKYNHEVTTLYYAPNINLFPSSKNDLIYSIKVYEKTK